MVNRTVLVVGFALIMSAAVAQAQDRGVYREFQLGSSLASVATLTGLAPTQARVIHERPALLQDLEWRPRYFLQGTASQTDPVDHMVFSFYNDQLYKIVVDYDARRTQGLTQSDVVDAISATYGVATLSPRKTQTADTRYGDPDVTLATWNHGEYTLVLFRASYQNSFRLTVSATRLADTARLAGLEAVRQDVAEAPQRERARQQKEASDAKAAEEGAKSANLPGFRP